MDFTDTELFHMSLAMSFFYEPKEPCEICEGIKLKIIEELKTRTVIVQEECKEGIEEIPVPEEYKKLGVVKWEIEHGGY